jgi:hypothetical protein
VVRRSVLPGDDAPSRRSDPPRHPSRRRRAPKCSSAASQVRHPLASWLVSSAPLRASVRRRPAWLGSLPTLPRQCEVTWWKRRADDTSRPGKPGRGAVAHALQRLWLLPRRLLPDAEVKAALQDALVSGLFSTDESVAIRCRFQHRLARSFHGLRSPSRSLDLRCRLRCAARFPTSRERGVGGRRGPVTGASPGGVLVAIPRSVALRPLQACAVRCRFAPGPIPAVPPFQRFAGGPVRAPACWPPRWLRSPRQAPLESVRVPRS